MRITIYKNCKLSNKYEEVFKSTTLLNTYLSTLSSLVIYNGDDIYFTNSGTLSIDNESTFDGSKYNYMKIEVNANITRYAFINSIVVVNGVAVIDYSEDTWSNYAIDGSGYALHVKQSLLAQATSLTNAYGDYTLTEISEMPKHIPVEYEGHQYPAFVVDEDNPLQTDCYILVTASMYKLAGAGTPSQRYISNYLLTWKLNQITSPNVITPVDSNTHYAWNIDADTLRNITELVAESSDQKVINKIVNDPDWSWEIIEAKMLPYSLAYDLFGDYLSHGDDADAGLFTDFEVSIGKVGQATDGTFPTFPCTIGFRNLMRYDAYKYTSGENVRYTYNGIKAGTILTSEWSIEHNWQYYAVGNYSRTIPNNPDGHRHDYKFVFLADADSCNISLAYDNQLFDVSKDFTIELPISAQSQDITQQQSIARRTGNIVTMMGMVKDTANLGWSVGSMVGKGTSGMSGGSMGKVDGMASKVSSIVSQGVGIASTGIQLDASNQAQYVINKPVNTNDVTMYNCMLNGIRAMESTPSNATFVNKMISTYGYLWNVLINNIETMNNATYMRFANVNVYGNFSQVIARELESILVSGIIVNV